MTKQHIYDCIDGRFVMSIDKHTVTLQHILWFILSDDSYGMLFVEFTPESFRVLADVIEENFGPVSSIGYRYSSIIQDQFYQYSSIIQVLLELHGTMKEKVPCRYKLSRFY